MGDDLRLLSIDLGDRRTGIAVGDTFTGLASPIGVIELPMSEGERGRALVDALAKAARENEANALVVGLPYNMDGTEGPRAKIVRAFAARVTEATGLETHFQDERLTSAEADWAMAGSGLTHKGKKRRRDALAAAAILRDYLQTLD